MTQNTSLPQHWLGLLVQYPYSAPVELIFPGDAQRGTTFTGHYDFQDHGEGSFTATISNENRVTMELERGSKLGNWHFDGQFYPPTMIVGVVTREGGKPVAALDVFTPEKATDEMPGVYVPIGSDSNPK